MNINELKLFRHLVGSLHFGKTSKACNVTPSALTRTIQRLESELNKQLFIRDNRSVKLTRAGELFCKYVDESIRHWNQFQSELARDSALYGELSLYASITAVYTILPDMLARFREIYPKIQIHLQTGDAAQALDKLANDEVDISIAALDHDRPTKLLFMEIIKTPLVFIRPVNDPEIILYKDDSPDWEKTPLIVAEKGLSRKRLQDWLSTKKIKPNIYAQVAGNEAIISMVGLGFGVGLIPQLVLEKSPMKEQVAVMENLPLLVPFSVGLCTVEKNLQNPVARSFWQLAEKVRLQA